jgi:ribonuclease P protein component
VTVTWLPGDSTEPPKVAYAVGRHVGGAVVRNRLRRRLRAVSTELEELLRQAGGAYLISAGPDAVGLAYQDLTRTVAEAVQEVVAKGEDAG